jgi:hypothetical protein
MSDRSPIQKLIDEAVLKEREACAQIADDVGYAHTHWAANTMISHTAGLIADRIRNRE